MSFPFFFRFSIFILIFLSSFHTSAQYYDIGQDPASVKWQIIKTENFKIVYPSDFEKNILKLANTMQMVHEYGTITLNHRPQKINLLIHNQSVVSNAYSLWTPQRMEFLTCPPQNTYAQDWLEQLAIHEYRHMVQMDKLNQGTTKVLSYLIGQHATAAVLGVYVPVWFLEGDAICTETALSNSGRGRIPAFEMISRAQLIEKGKFSFEKAQFGSYKDFVPDHYYFGYHFVAYTRKIWGFSTFENALNKTGRNPFLITPFNKGLKEITGLSKRKMYHLIWDSLKSDWINQQNQIEYTSYNNITKENKIYTNYKYPHYINDSTFLVEKSGKDDITRIIKLNKNGTESVLCTPGYFTSENISLNTNKRPFDKNILADSLSLIPLSAQYACWSEQDIHTRWEQKSFSVVKIYDFNKNKTKKLSQKTRYFSPCFFPDMSKLVVSEVTSDNQYYLTIIDANNGKEIKKINSPDNIFFTNPSVSSDGKNIYSIALTNKGKSIVAVDVESGKHRIILEPSFHEISNVSSYQHYIFFNADYSGIDNIYGVDTLSKQLFQLTSSKYGAVDIDISPDGKKMVYAEYTADGYCVAETAFNPANWKPLSKVYDNSIKLVEGYLSEEKGVIDRNLIANKLYESKPYRKLLHLFNPHSWLPFYLNADNIDVKPGVSLMSQNLLSNTFATVGYEWDKNIKEGRYHADISYKGLYPIFNFSYLKGKQAGIYQNQKYTYDISNLKASLSVPFAFLHNQFLRGCRFNLSTNYYNITHNESTPEILMQGEAQTMEYRVFAYNQVKSVERDIRPRWGQSIELNYFHSPFHKNNFGTLKSVEASFFFPGFFKHHSLQVYAGVQDKQKSDFYFGDVVSYPRGYSYAMSDDLFSISNNYRLPLAYPDKHVGSVLYIKKIQANLFIDYAQGKYNLAQKTYFSYGSDILSQVHLFRFSIPFYIGLRASYMPNEKEMEYEMLFNIDIANF
ncbi:MAG TPA: hypothetical protein PKZ21_03350 [Bacteroidales bacterium]|nr:hypothetical protein [Bacteroidales bacterium]